MVTAGTLSPETSPLIQGHTHKAPVDVLEQSPSQGGAHCLGLGRDKAAPLQRSVRWLQAVPSSLKGGGSTVGPISQQPLLPKPPLDLL